MNFISFNDMLHVSVRARLLVVGWIVVLWSFQIFAVVSVNRVSRIFLLFELCCECIYSFLVNCFGRMFNHVNSYPITSCTWHPFLNVSMDLDCSESYPLLCLWYQYYWLSIFYKNVLEVFCDDFDLFCGLAVSSFTGRWGRGFSLFSFFIGSNILVLPFGNFLNSSIACWVFLVYTVFYEVVLFYHSSVPHYFKQLSTVFVWCSFHFYV